MFAIIIDVVQGICSSSHRFETFEMIHKKQMKLWGMVSAEDEKSGFEVVLDDDWYLLLTEHGQTRARLDPSIYTLPELRTVVESLLKMVRSNPALQTELSDMFEMSIPELSFLAMLKFNDN